MNSNEIAAHSKLYLKFGKNGFTAVEAVRDCNVDMETLHALLDDKALKKSGDKYKVVEVKN